MDIKLLFLFLLLGLVAIIAEDSPSATPASKKYSQKGLIPEVLDFTFKNGPASKEQAQEKGIVPQLLSFLFGDGATGMEICDLPLFDYLNKARSNLKFPPPSALPNELSLMQLLDFENINAPEYRQMLETVLLPWAEENMGEEWTFQQDAAPSHRAYETQAWIEENVPDAITVDPHWSNPIGQWPPNSPELNLMDFFGWPYLQSKACSTSHNSIDALKASLVKEWAAIPQEMIPSTASPNVFDIVLKQMVDILMNKI